MIDGVIVNNQTVNEDQNAISRAGGGTSATGQATRGAPSIEDNGVNRIADINPGRYRVGRDPEGRIGLRDLRVEGVGRRGDHHHQARHEREAQVDVSGQVGQYKLSNTLPIRQFPTLASAQAGTSTT